MNEHAPDGPAHFDWHAATRASLGNRALDPAAEADLVEEIAQHLQAEFDALVSRGMSADAARERLLDQLSTEPLGHALERRAPYNEPRPAGAPARGAWLESVWQDARYGCRALVRTPAVSIVAVLSLALTIAANTAVFGLLDTLLLAPLHVSHPDQLFTIERALDRSHPGAMRAASPTDRPLLAYQSYLILRGMPGLQDLQAYATHPVEVSTGAEAVPNAWMDLVSGGFFDLIGDSPVIGRTFTSAEVEAHAAVAVISYDFWRDHLNRDPTAVGRTIRVNDVPVTIIGVSARGYQGLYFGRTVDVTLPLTATAGMHLAPLESMGLQLVGRADAGDRRAAVTQAVDAALRRCCSERIGDGGEQQRLVSAVDMSHGRDWRGLRDQYSRVVIVLFGGVAVLLLLGCANVATLLIARGTAREQQFAVRASLGASPGRIMQQLVVEGLELTLCGTALGLLLARMGTQMLVHALPAAAQALADDVPLHPSAELLLFTAMIVVVCTLICGVLPTLRVARADLRGALGSGQVQSRGRGGIALDRALIVSQVMLALVVVSTAMLFVATLRRFQDFDFGYPDDRVLLAAFEPPDPHGGGVPAAVLAQSLLASVRDMPGVTHAAAASVTPLFGSSRSWASIRVNGEPVDPRREPPEFALVTSEYFAATGIGLLRGREFTPADSGAADPVAIVSASLARDYFGSREPIGQRFALGWTAGTHQRWFRVVGVARDAYFPRMAGGMTKDVATPTEMFYVPLAQAAADGLDHPFQLECVLRTAGDPRGLETTFRHAVSAVPGARLSRLSSVHQVLESSIPRERLAATLGSIFAVIALSLAAAGFFGVVAYAVVRRTREVGIRIALGARPADTLWLMIREMLLLTLIGSAAGVALGRVAANAVRAQLYGISPSDPRVPIAAAAALLLVGFAASALPALRATRVDPLIALRSE